MLNVTNWKCFEKIIPIFSNYFHNFQLVKIWKYYQHKPLILTIFFIWQVLLMVKILWKGTQEMPNWKLANPVVSWMDQIKGQQTLRFEIHSACSKYCNLNVFNQCFSNGIHVLVLLNKHLDSNADNFIFIYHKSVHTHFQIKSTESCCIIQSTSK